MTLHERRVPTADGAGTAASASYVTPPDNFVQAPVRWLSGRVARLLVSTPVTPNHVTVARGVMNAAALVCFARGSYPSFVAGFVLFQIFEVLDHVDGDLARLRGTTSKVGVLLESLIDAYGARPSNLFGLCVALGMSRGTGGVWPVYLYAGIALGRLLWLEYRGPFGWSHVRGTVLGGEHGHYLPVIGTGSLKRSVLNLSVIVYTWQNQLILWGGLLRPAAGRLWNVDLLTGSLVAVAILNHLPWVSVVATGFWRALTGDNRES